MKASNQNGVSVAESKLWQKLTIIPDQNTLQVDMLFIESQQSAFPSMESSIWIWDDFTDGIIVSSSSTIFSFYETPHFSTNIDYNDRTCLISFMLTGDCGKICYKCKRCSIFFSMRK